MQSMQEWEALQALQVMGKQGLTHFSVCSTSTWVNEKLNSSDEGQTLGWA